MKAIPSSNRFGRIAERDDTDASLLSAKWTAALPLLRNLAFRPLAPLLIQRDVGLVFWRDMELSPVAEQLAEECRRVSRRLGTNPT